MNPRYRYDIIQNTDEWFEVKLGKFSASSADSLLMDRKNKGYQKLIAKIVEERITGERCENDSFTGNFATDRGHRLEPLAREDYELRTLQAVKLVGVVELDEWTLCSPDGLINDDGLHQIKCPIFSIQNEYLRLEREGKDVIPSNYYKQMQFELYITGRKYNVFTAFHPHLKPIDIVLERDEVLIAEIHERLLEAIEEVKAEIEKIKNY